MPDTPPEAAIQAGLDAGTRYTDQHAASPTWSDRQLVTEILKAAWPHMHAAKHGEANCTNVSAEHTWHRMHEAPAAARAVGFGKDVTA